MAAREPRSNERLRQKRFFWMRRVVTTIVLIAVFVFAIVALLIWKNQGTAQATTTLTIVSIILGVIIGLLSLLLAFLSWLDGRSSHQSTLSIPPSISERSSLDQSSTVSAQTGNSARIEDSSLVDATIASRSEYENRSTNGSEFPNRNLPREDWDGAPPIEHFYGRKKELSELEQWIVHDSCRIVAVVGIGGIGKTALAVSLAKQIKGTFEYLLWCELKNAPPLRGILRRSILFLSNQQRTDLPKDEESQIALLVHYLQEHRCLLVLDNAEAILQSGNHTGEYREDYGGYGRLIQRLGEERHQSCLLLTSREKPREVANLEGKTLPVRSLQLSGLGHEAAQKILKDKGLSGSNEALTTLTDLYTGNPLALQLVSEPIQALFGGDIPEFLESGTTVVGNVYDLVDQQFKRLSAREVEIMYWLAIEREATALESLQEVFIRHVSKRELLESLESLQQRSMIETRRHAHFTLQPVIMEYVIDQFTDQIFEEIKAEKIELFGSHALIKAQTSNFIRNSQLRLILMPVAQRLLFAFGKASVERMLKDILSRQREKQPLTASYAAGNALNILLQLHCDLRDFDFSSLSVWQAYLQGIALPGVNFSHADLSRSVFTETFESVLSVAFSPNGEFLATGTTGGRIWIWQGRSGRLLQTYHQHADWIRSIAFSPDGNLLASGSDDFTVRLWNVKTGEHLKTLPVYHRVWSVAFNQDGTLLASGGHDDAIQLWDVGTGQIVKTLHGHSGWVSSVVFSPDGTLLASGGSDQTIRLWDVKTGEHLKTLQGHTGWVRSIVFSPIEAVFASGSVDQTIRLWDVKTGEHLRTLQGHTDWIWTVTFSPDGSLLASCGSDLTVRLWDAKTGENLRTMLGHTNWVWSIAFHPDGSLLVSGGSDQTIQLWNIKTGQSSKTLQGHTDWVWSVAFSPDGTLLASGSNDQAIRLWDVRTGECLRTLQGHTNWIWSVAYSPDGMLLASGGSDRAIRLWDTKTGEHLRTLQGHTNWVWTVAFSPDGTTFASGGSDLTVRLWDVNTGENFRTLQGHTNWIWSVAYSPDGDIIASSGEDQTIRLWDVRTGEHIKTFQGHTKCIRSIVFSPEGDLLVSGSLDQTIRLWDVRTGEHIKTFQGHTNWITSVAFSPDKHIIASGSEDQTIRLWNIQTGETLKTLHGHTNWVTSVTFNFDGSTLASGSTDGTSKIWDVQTGACLNTMRCDRPYEGMNITNVTGLTEAQKTSLRTLGAMEDEQNQPHEKGS